MADALRPRRRAYGIASVLLVVLGAVWLTLAQRANGLAFQRPLLAPEVGYTAVDADTSYLLRRTALTIAEGRVPARDAMVARPSPDGAHAIDPPLVPGILARWFLLTEDSLESDGWERRLLERGALLTTIAEIIALLGVLTAAWGATLGLPGSVRLGALVAVALLHRVGMAYGASIGRRDAFGAAVEIDPRAVSAACGAWAVVGVLACIVRRERTELTLAALLSGGALGLSLAASQAGWGFVAFVHLALTIGIWRGDQGQARGLRRVGVLVFVAATLVVLVPALGIGRGYPLERFSLIWPILTAVCALTHFAPWRRIGALLRSLLPLALTGVPASFGAPDLVTAAFVVLPLWVARPWPLNPSAFPTRLGVIGVGAGLAIPSTFFGAFFADVGEELRRSVRAASLRAQLLELREVDRPGSRWDRAGAEAEWTVLCRPELGAQLVWCARWPVVAALVDGVEMGAGSSTAFALDSQWTDRARGILRASDARYVVLDRDRDATVQGSLADVLLSHDPERGGELPMNARPVELTTAGQGLFPARLAVFRIDP